MKLLFDQNLSHKLVFALKAEFPDSKHIRELGLGSADDLSIWEYAKQFGFTIVSKDSESCMAEAGEMLDQTNREFSSFSLCGTAAL